MTREEVVWAAATVELRASAGPQGRLQMVAGLILFLLAAQFMTVLMLAASMALGYDIGGGAIRDLGTIPATARPFNASLVLTGVLNVAGGVLLWRAGRRWAAPPG